MGVSTFSRRGENCLVDLPWLHIEPVSQYCVNSVDDNGHSAAHDCRGARALDGLPGAGGAAAGEQHLHKPADSERMVRHTIRRGGGGLWCERV